MNIVASPPAIHQTVTRTAAGFGDEGRRVDEELRKARNRASHTFWRRYLAEDSAGDAWQQLREVSALPPDWDGEDALPIAQQTLDSAENVLIQIIQETRFRRVEWVNPDISPTPKGGVYLHWSRPMLKFSVLVSPADDEIILLVGTGQGRSKRYSLPPAEIAAAVAGCLEREAELESIHVNA